MQIGSNLLNLSKQMSVCLTHCVTPLCMIVSVNNMYNEEYELLLKSLANYGSLHIILRSEGVAVSIDRCKFKLRRKRT